MFNAQNFIGKLLDISAGPDSSEKERIMPVLATIYVFKKLCSKHFAKTFDEKKCASKVSPPILVKKGFFNGKLLYNSGGPDSSAGRDNAGPRARARSPPQRP